MTTKTVRLRAIDSTSELHAMDDLNFAVRRLADPTTDLGEWQVQLCALVRARARLTGASVASVATVSAASLARLM